MNPGRICVEPHLDLAVLVGGVAHQLLDPGLRHRVGAEVRVGRDMAGDRRHADERTPAGGHQVRHGVLHEQERSRCTLRCSTRVNSSSRLQVQRHDRRRRHRRWPPRRRATRWPRPRPPPPARHRPRSSRRPRQRAIEPPSSLAGAPNRSTVSISFDSVRPQIVTVAPSAASRRAHAAPMPVPPPVTMNDFPLQCHHGVPLCSARPSIGSEPRPSV